MKSITILAITFLIFSMAGAQIPTNGLVAYYPFAGNANDQSGNSYNGTVTGASLTVDRFGNPNNAYQFNGTGNYVLFNNSFDLLPRTVSIWFNATTIDATLRIVYSSDNKNLVNGMTAVSLRRINNVNKLIFNVANILDTADITANMWHHVAITVSSGATSMYLDCNLVGTKNISSNYHSLDYSTNALVGASRALTNGFFAGIIDDVRIYDRVLNATELNAVCKEGFCFKTITVTDTLIINANITSYNPVTYQNSIKIYPNPGNDHITIDFGNYSTLAGYTLKITNSLSQDVYTSPINKQSVYIDLSTWSGNGIYFVYLKDASNNIVDVRKIVLQ